MHTLRRRFVRLSTTAVVAALATAALSVPTAAASVVNTSLSNVRSGFVSRNVHHSGSTAVQAGFIGCSSNAPAANSKFDIELRQNRSLQPDRSLGSRNAKQCFTSPTRVGWGDPTDGNYFMKVHSHSWQKYERTKLQHLLLSV